MEFNTEQFAEECVKSIQESVSGLNTLNIIVVGKTGVGKSTLINSVFREDLAVTGMGKPVTDHMSKISKEGFPLNIYDTRGFELGRDAQIQVRKEVIQTIKRAPSPKMSTSTSTASGTASTRQRTALSPRKSSGCGSLPRRMPSRRCRSSSC